VSVDISGVKEALQASGQVTFFKYDQVVVRVSVVKVCTHSTSRFDIRDAAGEGTGGRYLVVGYVHYVK